MEEKNQSFLKNKLSNLPEVEPHADSWAKLAQQLDFNEKINELLPELLEYPSDLDSWEKLASNLDKTKKGKVISLNRWTTYSSSIAASLLLFSIIYFANKTDTSESVKITYHKEAGEMIDPFIIGETVSANETEAIAFIKNVCQDELPVCQTNEFQLLKSQLDELSKEIEHLEVQLATNSDNPYLIKAHIKVENIRADVAKKLIKVITS